MLNTNNKSLSHDKKISGFDSQIDVDGKNIFIASQSHTIREQLLESLINKVKDRDNTEVVIFPAFSAFIGNDNQPSIDYLMKTFEEYVNEIQQRSRELVKSYKEFSHKILIIDGIDYISLQLNSYKYRRFRDDYDKAIRSLYLLGRNVNIDVWSTGTMMMDLPSEVLPNSSVIVNVDLRGKRNLMKLFPGHKDFYTNNELTDKTIVMSDQETYKVLEFNNTYDKLTLKNEQGENTKTGTKEVKIKYAKEQPYRLEQHGDFIDLAISEDIDAKKGELIFASFGVAMQLPKGYYAEVVPRSSTAKKHGLLLSNSVGIIDNEYNGPEDWWGGNWFAFRDTHVDKGTRIAQFRLVKDQGKVTFTEDNLEDNTNRGGFGSTGSGVDDKTAPLIGITRSGKARPDAEVEAILKESFNKKNKDHAVEVENIEWNFDELPNLYLQGEQGSGKSTFLISLVKKLINKGQVSIIDTKESTLLKAFEKSSNDVQATNEDSFEQEKEAQLNLNKENTIKEFQKLYLDRVSQIEYAKKYLKEQDYPKFLPQFLIINEMSKFNEFDVIKFDSGITFSRNNNVPDIINLISQNGKEFNMHVIISSVYSEEINDLKLPNHTFRLKLESKEK